MPANPNMTEQNRGVGRSEIAVRLAEGFRNNNVVELEFDEAQTAELMGMVVRKGLEKEKSIKVDVADLVVVMSSSEETHDKGIVRGMVNVQKPVEAKEVPVALFLGNDEQSPGELKLMDLRVNGRWGNVLRVGGGEKKVRKALEDVDGLIDEVLHDQLEREGIVYAGSEKKFERGKFHLKVGRLKVGAGDTTPRPDVVSEIGPPMVENVRPQIRELREKVTMAAAPLGEPKPTEAQLPPQAQMETLRVAGAAGGGRGTGGEGP